MFHCVGGGQGASRRGLARTLGSGLAAAAFAAGLMAPVLADCPPGFEFRVNAVDGNDPNTPGYGFSRASMDVVRSGPLIDSMAFAWSNDFIINSAPGCPDLFYCGDIETYIIHGSSAPPEATVFARRFDPNGVPNDAGDTRQDLPNGCFSQREHASTAVQRRAAAEVQIAWQAEWDPVACAAICAPTACLRDAVQYSTSRWPFAGGPTATGVQPFQCWARRPSIAYSTTKSLTLWTDSQFVCQRLMYRNGDGVPQVLRPYIIPHIFEQKCVAAAPGERFVAVWNEQDPNDSVVYIMAARIDNGTPGAVFTVGVSGRSAAVACADDGSFAVVYFDEQPPPGESTGGRVQLYDAAEPPNPIGGPIFVHNDYDAERHTICVLGPSILDPTTKVSAVWQRPPKSNQLLYANVDADGGYSGPSRDVVLDPNRGFCAFLGESGQHTAQIRPDGKLAVVWHCYFDGNVYCTVRERVPDCYGDADDDYDVDQDDMDLVLFNFDQVVPVGESGDVDCDGFVDQDDLDLILFYFGTVCL